MDLLCKKRDTPLKFVKLSLSFFRTTWKQKRLMVQFQLSSLSQKSIQTTLIQKVLVAVSGTQPRPINIKFVKKNNLNTTCSIYFKVFVMVVLLLSFIAMENVKLFLLIVFYTKIAIAINFSFYG